MWYDDSWESVCIYFLPSFFLFLLHFSVSCFFFSCSVTFHLSCSLSLVDQYRLIAVEHQTVKTLLFPWVLNWDCQTHYLRVCGCLDQKHLYACVQSFMICKEMFFASHLLSLLPKSTGMELSVWTDSSCAFPVMTSLLLLHLLLSFFCDKLTTNTN